MRSRHCVVTVSSLSLLSNVSWPSPCHHRHRVILIVVTVSSLSSPCGQHRRSSSLSLIASSPRRPPPPARQVRADASWPAAVLRRDVAPGRRPRRRQADELDDRRQRNAQLLRPRDDAAHDVLRAVARADTHPPRPRAHARHTQHTGVARRWVDGGRGGEGPRTSEGRPSRRDTAMLGGQRVLVGVEKYLNLTFGFCFFDAQLFFRKSSWNSVTQRCAEIVLSFSKMELS